MHPVRSTPIWATRCRSRGRAISAPTTIEAARRQLIADRPHGTPQDIAEGNVFLASDDAVFVTGAGLVIDGGITAQ